MCGGRATIRPWARAAPPAAAERRQRHKKLVLESPVSRPPKMFFLNESGRTRPPSASLRSAVRVSVTLIRVCPPSLTRAFASRIAYRPRFSLACGVPRRQVVRGLLALSLVVPLPLVLGCSGASPVHLIYVPACARALSARAPPRASSAMCPVLCVHMPRSGVADPCALHPCARRRVAAQRGIV